MRHSHTLALALTAASLCTLGGCVVGNFIGGMAQNEEYQKKILVPAEYDGLAGKTVAVLVDVNMTMMYEHPRLQAEIALTTATALQRQSNDKLPGIKVVSPEQTLSWQSRNPGWNLLSYGDIAEALGVERVVILDVYEYRLNPAGNRYEWAGACAANVRIVENDADTFDPDLPQEFSVIARFPEFEVVPWESATASRIHDGLLLRFVQKTAWLFYQHEEPKYPDKYRPELDVNNS
jgi:hypothetical protein